MELTPYSMEYFVLEIRWRLCIGDAKPSSNFSHKLSYKSECKDTTNLQHPENSFGELAKRSGITTSTQNKGDNEGLVYKR